MDNFAQTLIILWSLFFLYLLINFLLYIKYRYHIKQLKSQPLRKEFKHYIENLPHYKNLSSKEKAILEYKMQLFMEDKNFVGVYIEVNNEMRVVISFFASLMTLNYEDFFFDNLDTIYIYPHTIIKEEKGYLNEELLISGEAVFDTVIFSWHEIKRDLKNLKRNVIIHEFAHILDFSEGSADGIPPIKDKHKWVETIIKKYEELEHSHHIFIDSYALTNPSEFFAVISEYFFMQPKKLKLHYPIVYKELENFYKIDTIKLTKGNSNGRLFKRKDF